MAYLGTIATIASIAGTGLTAYGAYAQGQAQKKASEYNADLAQRQAGRIREDAQTNAARRREDHGRALARLRAQYGAQGLAMDGAPLDMYGHQAGKFELEIADMYAAAERRAAAMESNAALSSWEGQQQAKAGVTSAFSTALSGGAEIAGDMYDKYQKTGSVLGRGEYDKI